MISLYIPRVKFGTMKIQICLVWCKISPGKINIGPIKWGLHRVPLIDNRTTSRKGLSLKQVSSSLRWRARKAKRASNSTTVILKYCLDLSWYRFNTWTRLWNLLSSTFHQQVHPKLSFFLKHVYTACLHQCKSSIAKTFSLSTIWCVVTGCLKVKYFNYVIVHHITAM